MDAITTADGRTIQLSELERVARAATPGPWEADWLGTNHFEVHSLAAGAEFWVLTDASAKGEDLDFIAAANPLTCLALIAEVRRQAEENATLREWKSSILSALKTVPEFETGEWAGDKEGWGFCFEFIHWMRREIASLRERVAELEAGLRPFADASASLDMYSVWSRGGSVPLVSDYRRAAALLAKGTLAATGKGTTSIRPVFPIQPEDMP